MQDVLPDPITDKSNLEAVVKELERELPRKDVILPLMKRLFSSRRHFILNDAVSVAETLLKYPALKLPFVVSLLACTQE